MVPALNSNPSSQTTPPLLNSMAGAPSFSTSFAALTLPFHPFPSGTAFRSGVRVCAVNEQVQQARTKAVTLRLGILIFMVLFFRFFIWIAFIGIDGRPFWDHSSYIFSSVNSSLPLTTTHCFTHISAQPSDRPLPRGGRGCSSPARQPPEGILGREERTGDHAG